MFLLIATVFIAELIIASTVIFFIKKADRFIVQYNSKVCELKPQVEKALSDLKFCVTSFGKYYDYMIESIKKKRRQFQINLFKNILMYFSLFLLKGKYKRAAAIVQFGVLFHDYLMKVRSE